MYELIKAYGFIGFQQAFVLIFSLVRTKIISAYLGPAGLGVFAQANAFVLLMYQVATFGTGVAVSTMIAEQRGKQRTDGVMNLIVVIWGLNTTTAIIMLLLCLGFAEPLAGWAFGSTTVASYLVISALAGFIFVQVRLMINLLRGLLEWQAYALISSLTLLLGIGVVAGLVVQFGMQGAVWSLLAIQLLNLLSLAAFFIFRVKRKYGLNFSGLVLDTAVLGPVMRVARPVVLILILEPLAGFLVRTEIIHSMGVDMNGQYQVLAGISLAYMNFLKETRLTYTMPKAASTLEDLAYITRMQNNNLRLGMYLILPLTILILAFRELAINLLYSESFLLAANLLIWQFIGDAMQVLRINLNFVLVPMKRFGYYLFDGAVFWAGWLGLSLVLIPKYGLLAVPVAHAVFNSFLVITGYIYHHKSLGFQFSKGTISAVFLLFPLTGLSYLVSMMTAPSALRVGVTLAILVVIGIDVYRRGIHRLLFKPKSFLTK